MVWNCRGAASKAFNRYSKHYIDAYKSDVFVILETRSDPSLLSKILKRLGIRCGSEGNWLFTVVYASPQENKRKVLWEEIKTLAENVNSPWMLAGDFNDMAFSSEKKGGAISSTRKCKVFRDNINDCRLLQVDMAGLKFTWRGPMYHGGQRIYERLDRFLCNEDWKVEFPDAHAKVLTRVEFSDHHPILINLNPQNGIRPPRVFRFESAWLANKEYTEMLWTAWIDSKEIGENLRTVKEEIHKWKMHSLDQVINMKKNIMARLAGIQNCLQRRHNTKGMVRLEKKLQVELSHILKQEEVMWFQRSRTQWLVDGDRNTKYYHLTAVNRRKRNKIVMLKDLNGQWVEDHKQLQLMVTDFYKDLFSCKLDWDEKESTVIKFPIISPAERSRLEEEVSNDEIRKALFSMKPWKAPGPDGYPTGFYQRSWKVVGNKVCEFIKDVWRNPFRIAEVNQTDICLIPKMENPQTVSHFRPISLCNSIYKIMSKMVIKEIELPPTMLNIIMHSITSVETNVNWHGAKGNFFRPQRGIRQGDPISPYIFVLCMDKLTHLIENAIRENKWQTIKMGKHGPGISHLMFADDVLIFGEATEEQMINVVDILQRFGKMSGHEVSNEKSSVLYSNNVPRGVRNMLTKIANFRETSSFGKYLRVPLSGKALKRNDFHYILEQVEGRLANWKANVLSFAGRVTLVKSVIEVVPTYAMMTNMLPISCIKDIQRVQRNFIWGDTSTKKKMHLVNWDTITNPKDRGGLGLRKLEIMNKACLMKLNSGLLNNSQEL
ncbi:uncharacterized protein LOC131635855 [Vicia villosa]|uniref:uncharacterized protein LOC131635855 n=1 Tax=Vicia villosa TaxID=3911 RepID=UPI00273C59A0|nr:uncharacterized protein LOC131635855 [Vicia villosa]